jgi:hypothetical protein
MPVGFRRSRTPFWRQLDPQDTLPRSSGIAQSFGFRSAKAWVLPRRAPNLNPKEADGGKQEMKGRMVAFGNSFAIEFGTTTELDYS